MSLLSGKKSTMQMVVNIALIILGLIIIIGVIYQFFARAEESAAEAICRGSVAARERTFSTTLKGVGPNIALSPILCKTIDKDIPLKVSGTREDVKDDFGELAAKCWWQFGQGLVDADKIVGENVFEWQKDKCFICYTAAVRETDSFSRTESVTKADLQSWLNTNYYEAVDTRLATVSDEAEDRSKTECERKGGECLRSCREGQERYSDWLCGSREGCCVDRNKLLSYVDYVQSSGGEGRLDIIDGLTIHPGETYAVTMVFLTPIDWNPWDWKWTGGKINRILISKLSEVNKNCHIQKDVQGR